MLAFLTANGAYTPQQRQHQALPKQSSPNDIRQSQVFHGYPHFPPQAAQSSVSLTPSLHDGIDGPLSGHPTAHPASSSSAIAASAPAIPKLDDNSHDESNEHRAPSAVSTSVYGDLPEAKRRKFIIVEDIERNNQHVRIRANLDPVDVAEIPDSYRKTYSVYPRSYYPIQMPSPTRKASKGNRFFEDDESGGGNASGQGAGEEEAVMGRTMVPVPMLEGAEGEVAVPKIGRAKRRREEMVNDLGNRMIWTHSRVFSERTMYLQRAREYWLPAWKLHGKNLMGWRLTLDFHSRYIPQQNANHRLSRRTAGIGRRTASGDENRQAEMAGEEGQGKIEGGG